MMNLFMKKRISSVLLGVLFAATACSLTGCKDIEEPKSSQETETESATATATETAAQVTTIVGEGTKEFAFVVMDIDGNETDFTVKTDAKTVGEALLSNELIEGDEGEFGLYVKKVNGIEADFDKDGTYWAFYINGEYAVSGVDTTDIEEGASYMLKVEK